MLTYSLHLMRVTEDNIPRIYSEQEMDLMLEYFCLAVELSMSGTLWTFEDCVICTALNELKLCITVKLELGT